MYKTVVCVGVWPASFHDVKSSNTIGVKGMAISPASNNSKDNRVSNGTAKNEAWLSAKLVYYKTPKKLQSFLILFVLALLWS